VVLLLFQLGSRTLKSRISVIVLTSILTALWIFPVVSADGYEAGFTMWALPAGRLASGIAVDSRGVWYACLSGHVGHLVSQKNTFEEWSIGRPESDTALYLDFLQDSIYFTDFAGNKIGKLILSMDKVSFATIPTSDSGPVGIEFPAWTLPEHPVLYFAESRVNSIGSLTLGGVLFDLLLPAPRSTTTGTPNFNIVAPDILNVMPRVTPGGPGTTPGVAAVTETMSGPFSEWHTPSAGRPSMIALGDGTVWFSAEAGPQVGKLTFQAGPDRFDIYYLPTTSKGSEDIKLDSAGNVWYTSPSQNIIGKLNPSTGAVSEWTIPTPNSLPWNLAIDRSGGIWFTESMGNKIGMLDPSKNKFYEWPVPAGPNIPGGLRPLPYALVIDPNDNIWFTESGGAMWSGIGGLNRNGQMVPEFPTNTLIMIVAIAAAVLATLSNRLKRKLSAT
jgi:streptogramin lyase